MRWLVILETRKSTHVRRFDTERQARDHADAHRSGRYVITIARAE